MATNTPPKSEIVGDWMHQQSWGPTKGDRVELVASFHLDDPEGEVGMQVFVVLAEDALYQVPLTYRAEPLPDAEASFMALMEHSMLGTRHVYDGLGDDRFVTVLAGVAAAGYGQALGFAKYDDRWHAVPDEMLVRGTGTIEGRVPVDGFAIASASSDKVVLRNDRFELTVFRRLHDRAAPAVGLTATWPGQTSPVTLVAARELSR